MVFIAIFLIVSNGMKKVMHGKPKGPYYSSRNIKESRKSGVWNASYSSDRIYYQSSNGSDTYSFKEIWIERNTNNPKSYPIESTFDWILNLYFKKVTEKDLHEFRIIGTFDKQREHPDGYPRVRFLLKDLKDTIRLEVIERNPKDSLAWLTEKVVDTVVIYKIKP